jgi:hypothetical protein
MTLRLAADAVFTVDDDDRVLAPGAASSCPAWSTVMGTRR